MRTPKQIGASRANGARSKAPMPVEIILVAARWRQQRICGIQKTNFDYDIASIETNPENPAGQPVLSLRRNDGSIRSHEPLFRFEVALEGRISRAVHGFSSSRIRKPTETRGTTGFQGGTHLRKRRLILSMPRTRLASRKKLILQNEPTNPLKILHTLPRLILSMPRTWLRSRKN